MPKSKESRFCLGVWNCDTESTVEGYISAFMANPFRCRLVRKYPAAGRGNPSKRYLNLKAKADGIIDGLMSENVRLVRQDEMRNFAKRLQTAADEVERIYLKMDGDLQPDKISVYWVLHFANIEWDFDVIRGIFFDPARELDCCGSYSDMIQFRNGHIVLRDFLRCTGFRSVKMAGLVCTGAKKQDGSEVYKLKRKDIPKRFEDYPEKMRIYMDNDVLVMDEALNIILNRRENLTIQTYNDLPMTATGFGRWRYTHNPEITIEDGKEVNVSSLLTFYRWKYARPFILYLMRSYKGGYCGPNPHIQYQILDNVICKDAVSMYPHKMLFFEMMQANKYTKMIECPYTLSECENNVDPVAKSALFRIQNVYDYLKTFDENGLFTQRPDDHLHGICPWIGTVELTIKGVRENNGIQMMPFLSKHKIENEPQNFVHCNGKILRGENIIVVMSSVDLMLTLLCYDCEIIRLRKWLSLSWRPMLPIQKRDLWEAYKRKMHISKVLKRDRYSNNDYWRDECGFDPALINALSDEEYREFAKAYKALCKADPNGKYGMTVEKPIKPKTTVSADGDAIKFETETVEQMNARVFADVIKETPNFVKASDYCAGASITMWARFQLVTMMYCLFVQGFETYYCDTDSLFVSDCPVVESCFDKYNERMKTTWYETNTGNETVTVDSSEGLGQFETDKKCKLFRTIGAKNYAYYDGNKIKLTVAGLRVNDYQKFLADKLKTENPKRVLERYYRPNTFIMPDACHKLLKKTDKMGFDKYGWRGCVLEECGFAMCDMNSRFHINNAIRAALAQGLKPDSYLGEFFNPLYVTKDGFTNRMSRSKLQKALMESFETLEDRQPIPKGVI